MTKVSVDCKRITDWTSFHDEFAQAFGFPAFYGRNIAAWIDCMTSLDDPDAGMSAVHASEDSVVVLELKNVAWFRDRCREQYEALIDGAAFVNWRKLEVGESAVLALSYYR